MKHCGKRRGEVKLKSRRYSKGEGKNQYGKKEGRSDNSAKGESQINNSRKGLGDSIFTEVPQKKTEQGGKSRMSWS